MSITVLQALLITLFCIISNLMFPLLGDIGGYFGLGRPLIAGTITGLIVLILIFFVLGTVLSVLGILG